MGSPEDSLSRRRSDAGPETAVRILTVDDDEAYLRYLRLVLSRAGFVPEGATSGAAAIERLRRSPPIDILVIDLAMPDLDGIETVRLIHEETPASSLYTILLTASANIETKLRAFEGGFDDFLPKSAGEAEIVAKIRSAGRRVELERRLFQANQELETLALTDELTGIANRRALFRTAGEILRKGKLAVVLFDLDRFKAINDTYGHLAGDRILADVASSFKANTRYGDVIGRYGGDEFFLLLPDTTAEEAHQITQRLVANIRQLRWTLNDTVVTISVQYGIAASPMAGTTVAELLAVCDKALYRGKQRGAARPDATGLQTCRSTRSPSGRPPRP
ncbi:MAG TPA: diguanylate cyclase [Thermoanaerobaculia bacterium]|nr:diguanylate cyclase [Thermoanaerobaculia bacterium]